MMDQQEESNVAGIRKAECLGDENGGGVDDASTLEASKRRKLDDGSAAATTTTDPASSTSTSSSSSASLSDVAKERERIVGISLYLNEAEGFSGEMKQRYSDFVVNEIGLDGETIHLDDMESVPLNADARQLHQDSITEEDKSRMVGIVGEELATKFFAFVEALKTNNKESFLFEGLEDKEVRSKLHEELKQRYGDYLFGSTDPERRIKVIYDTQGNISAWPKDRPQYLSFVLCKENKETNEALGVLAKMLRVKPKAFTYAGTKDKRGVTAQRVTIHKMPAQKVRAVNSKLFGFKVGNYRYVPSQLRLGDLYGNRFTVGLRDVTASDDVIQKAIDAIKTSGFINYYGHQRFGAGCTGTHTVGICLLKGDYEKAVGTILAPNDMDNVETRKVKTAYAEGRLSDIAPARLPKFMFIERTLLTSLKSSPKGFLNALQLLPRNIRQMYVHGFQSYIWNNIVNERLKLFGTSPVIGDLVFDTQSSSKADGDEQTADDDDDVEFSDDIVEHVRSENMKVKVLTEEDVKNYTIYDVVMPLPGWDITYPKNAIGDKFKELMNKEGIELEHLKSSSKDFSLPGSYRKIVVKPEKFEGTIRYYDAPNEPICENDFDRVQKKPLPPSKTSGTHKAVVLSFSLPSSSYATMCMRELMKQTTYFVKQSNFK